MANSPAVTEESQPNYSALAIEDLVRDKVWKARVSGYGRLAEILSSLSSASSPIEIVRKYADLMHLIPMDYNAAALDAGLAPLIFWIKASNSDPFFRSVRRDLIGPLVEKGLNSSRTSTKAQSLESLVEIAVKDGTSVLFVSFGCRILFQDALSELLTHKNAKVVACAISAASSIIQELGTTHAQCKGLLSSLSRLFSETDKGVRAEPPVAPKRRLASEKSAPVISVSAEEKPSVDACDDEPSSLDSIEYDIWESAPEVEISALFHSTTETLLASAWKEKKALLDALGDALNPSPRLKLASGRLLEEIICALGRLISIDVNIAVVLSSARCVERIAHATRANFPAGKHPVLILHALLGRTREKKSSVVDCLMAAAQAILSRCAPPITFQSILEAVGIGTGTSLLGNKIESLRLLLWSLKKYRLVPTKGELSALLSSSDPPLHSLTADSAGEVRDIACEVFGALLLRCGNNNLILQKALETIGDKLKISKIQAFSRDDTCSSENGVAPNLLSTASGSTLSTPTQPTKQMATAPRSASQAKPIKIGAKPSHTSVKPSTIGASNQKAAHDIDKNCLTLPEPTMSESTAKDMIGAIVPTLLNPSSNWKERLATVERSVDPLCAAVKGKQITLESLVMATSSNISSESVVAVILAQLNMLEATIASIESQASQFCVDAQRSLSSLLTIAMKCLGDLKASAPFSKLVLTIERICSERNGKTAEILTCSLINALGKASSFPKATMGAFSLCSLLVPRMCSKASPLDHSCVELMKGWISSHMASAQPALRNAALSFAGLVLSHHNLAPMGYASLGLSKPPELSTCCSHPCSRDSRDIHPPAPGSSAPANNMPFTANVVPQTQPDVELPTALCTAVSASSSSAPHAILISPCTMATLCSSAWKERKAALDAISMQISELPEFSITGTVSFADLVEQLSKRFEDSNKNIAVQALELFRCLISRIDLDFSNCFRTISNVLPVLINSLSDLKSPNRVAAHAALTSVATFAGENHIAALISEVLGRVDGHPQMKKEILLWLDSNLPTSNSDGRLEDVGATSLPTNDRGAAYSLEMANALVGAGSTSKFFLASFLPSMLQDRLPECRRAALSILGKLVLVLGMDVVKASILQHSQKGSPLLPAISSLMGTSLSCSTSMGSSTNIPQLPSACRTTPLKTLGLNSPMQNGSLQMGVSGKGPLSSSFDGINRSCSPAPSSRIPTVQPVASFPSINFPFSAASVPALPSPPFLADLSNSVLVQRLVSVLDTSINNGAPLSIIESLRSQRMRDSTPQADMIALIGRQSVPMHIQNPISPQWRAADSLLEIGIFCPSWVRSLLLSDEKVLLAALEALRTAIPSHLLSKAIVSVMAEPLLRSVMMCVIGRGDFTDTLSSKSMEMSSRAQISSSAVMLSALDAIEEISGTLESHSGRLAASEATHLALFLISLSTLDPREAVRQRARRFLTDGFLRIYPASKLLSPLLIDLVEATSAGMSMQESSKEVASDPSGLLALALPLAASVRARSELADLASTVIQRVGPILLASNSSDTESRVGPEATSGLRPKSDSRPDSRPESKSVPEFDISELSRRIVDVAAMALACNESDSLVRRSLIGMLSALASAIPATQLVELLKGKFGEFLSCGRTIIGGDAELASIIEKIIVSTQRVLPNSPRPFLHAAALGSPLAQTKRAANAMGGSPLSAHLRQRKKDLLAKLDAAQDDEERLPASLADLSMDNICVNPEGMIEIVDGHQSSDSSCAIKGHGDPIEANLAHDPVDVNIELLLQQISSPESATALEAVGVLSFKLPSSTGTGSRSDAAECSLLAPYTQMLCVVLCRRIKKALSCKLSMEETRVAEEALGTLLAVALNASLLETVRRPGIEALFDLLLSSGLLQVVEAESSSATLPLISNLVLKAVISNAHPGHVIGLLIEWCSTVVSTGSPSPSPSITGETVLQCLWRASRNFEIFLGKGTGSPYQHRDVLAEILSSCLYFIRRNPVSAWSSYKGINETTVRSIKTILQQVARWAACSNVSLNTVVPPVRNVPNEGEASESLHLLLSHLTGNDKSVSANDVGGMDTANDHGSGDADASFDRRPNNDGGSGNAEMTIDAYRSRLSGYTSEFYRLTGADGSIATKPVDSPVSEMKKATLLASSNLSIQISSIKERLAKIRDSR
ncbi:ARM repeat-containing protein [Mitosporidium daphniae]|uniref:ARM repeat-containing protein n=1 Tax=Mitosporidium daphniae TaxID=1485682 RepID=A0A098VT84_9MICR|nr:ARM repeat-containing protein [Mitosporidium daphniae]KGG52303.1 ARM repeat-containing protein [Mitosporidium daphniae]|eukprot:XP_013238764.1 ARM repeat-containing protein [Mitosporidium daphniae]